MSVGCLFRIIFITDTELSTARSILRHEMEALFTVDVFSFELLAGRKRLRPFGFVGTAAVSMTRHNHTPRGQLSRGELVTD